MIIKYFELKNKLNKEVNFFLLYGQNKGLIEETINDVLKPNFSKNVNIYEETEILNNLDNFKIEIFNKSFFEDDKLIIINRTSDKILETIKEIIDQEISGLKIILKSSVLEKKSKLRAFFEKSKNSVCVPFYPDNEQTLNKLALNFLKILN